MPPLPPALPSVAENTPLAAHREQRLQAGMIDHAIDSSVWIWLIALAMWCAYHLEATLDLRTFAVTLANQFPRSIMAIGLLLIADLLLCVRRGQSLGQLLTHIYKHHETSGAPSMPAFTAVSYWLHGLISRCLGLPLLLVCLVLLLWINPSISPIHLQDYSFIDPSGAARLLLALLKIIVAILLLFALFIPAGLGFIRGGLPTWYDRMLDVHILIKPQKTTG